MFDAVLHVTKELNSLLPDESGLLCRSLLALLVPVQYPNKVSKRSWRRVSHGPLRYLATGKRQLMVATSATWTKKKTVANSKT